MEQIEDPFESCSSRDEKEEALDLLEECWFFENSLNRKTRRSRCNSDICSSSSFALEMQAKNSGDANALSPRKLGEEDNFDRPDLVRLPSPPPCLRREEETQEEKITHSMSQLNLQTLDQVWFQTATQLPTSTGSEEGTEEKESDSRRTILSGQSTHRNLLRTPSLPPYIGREEIIQDTESHPPMNKSSREAPPDLPPHKGMRQSYSLSRYRPPRNLEVEARRGLINQSKLRKSLSDLELEEVQGFKDLGFTFDKEVSPSVLKILPGLQEKKPEDLDEDKVSRPYLSDAWFVQSSPPLVPNCVRKGSAEDMKAQIKFWAKAVASNVRQEC